MVGRAVEESPMPVRRRFCRALRRDEGFTLIESVVALGIATIVFMALAFALIGGVHQALFAQQNQQAGDLLNKTVEQARGIGYDSLAMRPTDLSVGDTLNLGGCNCYNPKNNSTTGTGVENLVLDPAGLLSPHVTTVAQNGLTFTVRRYLTLPTDSIQATYKRLTVLISWSSLGKTHVRSSSTLIAPTVRGLPLPDFKFSNAGPLSQCRNPGSTAVYAFNLTNNGARDSWTLTTDQSSQGWSFYADSNNNGSYDAGTDQTLAVNGTGTPQTAPLEPNTTTLIFAVADMPSSSSQTPPYTWTTNFTATSVAVSTVSQTLTAATSVVSGACPAPPSGGTTPPVTGATPPPTPPASCPAFAWSAPSNPNNVTLYSYYLHNTTANNDNTNAQAVMPLDKNGPTSSSLWDYSQDLMAGTAGRYQQGSGGSGIGNLATWQYGIPSASTVKGTGYLFLYAMAAGTSSTNQQAFTVTLKHLTSKGAVVSTVSTATYTANWTCTGFQPFTVNLSMPSGGESFAANDILQVQVSATGTTLPMLLAYDTSNYRTALTLPFSKGVG